MTPKQKALKLCQSFGMTTLFAEDCNNGITLPLSIAKKCALIAVDEILSSFNSFMDARKNFRHELEIDAERYWQQVKTEIGNL